MTTKKKAVPRPERVKSSGAGADPGSPKSSMSTTVFDGRGNGYMPGTELRIDPSLALHRDYDPEVDPITYEVVRSSLWNINLEHGEAIKRTSGSPVVLWSDDFNQSIQTE